MIKAVLFDLDGTILDTIPDITNIYRIVFENRGYEPVPEEVIRLYIGNGLRYLASHILPEGVPCTEDYIEEVKRTYVTSQNVYTKYFPGIKEALSALKENGYKLAIVSNKIEEAVGEVARKYFPGIFDFVIGSSNGKKKPDPYTTWEAMENLGVTKEECIYCGDMLFDILTAHNAGISCIGAAWGYRGRAFLEENGADFIADAPEDILGILEKISQ